MYSHHFRNGVFGSGLLTLSAFPILEASFSAFAAAGDPLAVLQGDGVAGKGVGCVALDLSSSSGGGIVGDGRGRSGRRSKKGGRAAAARGERGNGGGSSAAAAAASPPLFPEVLVVANTHLAAAYRDAHEEFDFDGTRAAATAAKKDKKRKKTRGGGGVEAASRRRPLPLPFVVPSDANGPVRLAQTIALAESVRGFAASAGAGSAILCGDLNAPPRSLEAALLRRLSPGVVVAAPAAAAAASAAAAGEEDEETLPLGDAWAFLEEKAAAAEGELEEEEDGEGRLPPAATPGRDRWGGATANRPLDDEGGKGGGGKGVSTSTSTATAGAGKRPARLDFIWSFCPRSRLLPVSARIALTRDGESGRRLSDHAGVEVVFELLPFDPRRKGGGGGEVEEEAESGGVGGVGGDDGGGLGPDFDFDDGDDPLAVAVPLIEERALRAGASADAAGAAALGCLVAAAAVSSATLLRLSSSFSPSSSPSSPSSSALSLSLSLALALALSFALGSLSALLFALGYGGRHALASALGAAAGRARLRLDSDRRGRRRR